MLAIWYLLDLVVTIQAEMEGFIVGGKFTTIFRYPHSAFLAVSCVRPLSDARFYWMCGSSIINQRILVTAGHCLYPCTVGTSIFVNMGNEDRHNGIKRIASGFVLHENYNPTTSASDIGLIKLFKPVGFNEKISRVAIMKDPPYSEPAHLAGWGLTDENTKEQAIKLKSLDQKVWRYHSCQVMFGETPKGTICASSKKGKKNFAAQGDSGSGLLVRGYIQIGLVSYKIPSVANNVIVYTDVGYYYDWISHHARRLYCDKEVARSSENPTYDNWNQESNHSNMKPNIIMLTRPKNSTLPTSQPYP